MRIISNEYKKYSANTELNKCISLIENCVCQLKIAFSIIPIGILSNFNHFRTHKNTHARSAGFFFH